MTAQYNYITHKNDLERYYQQGIMNNGEINDFNEAMKWSGKFGQRAKVYPTRTNGYENDKTTELFRPV